ncbi:MAG: hypothetical protein KBD01_17505 [Acidobacteria bacterium]|nr:hypothetical protein [Acidobacteriota bacterium]
MPDKLSPSMVFQTGEVQYRVPKVPVAVELVLTGGARVLGNLHVLPQAGLHEGRERVIEILNAPDPFVPITSGPEGSLVHKRHIVLARVGSPEDAGLTEVDLACNPSIDVDVRLAGLPPVRGSLRIDQPPGHVRLLDHVNAAEEFFPVVTADGAAIVARRHVVEIRQIT